MNTYSTGKLNWLLTSFLLLVGMSLYAENKPNVILILTDDQGFGDWGWNGQHPYLNTPAIDKLSKEGVFMTDFHGVALCGPSRAALMSGRHCYYSRVWQGRHKMRGDIPTMGNVFQHNGYKTAMYGKWHLGQEYPFGPQHRGFDDTICIGSGMVTTIEDYPGNNAATLTDLTLRHNGEFKKFEDRTKYPNGYYSTDLWFDKAQEFIGNRGDDPFFVMISTDAPHAPHVPHPLFKDTFNGVSGIDNKTKSFYGQLLGVDYQLGKLRKYLADENLTNNTIIVFMSDNGSAVASGVYNGPAIDSSAPAGSNNNFNISGGKASNPDGGHRVPFFVYYPDGGVTGGRRSNVLSNNIDVIPTLIDLCDLQTPVANSHWEGVSLAPILKGNATALAKPNRFLHQGYSTAYEPPVGKGGVGMRADWRLFGNGAMFNMASDITQGAQTVNQTIKNEMNTEWDTQLNFFKEKVFPFEDPYIIGSDVHPLTRLTTSSWAGNGLGFWQDLNDPFNPNKKQFGNYLVKAAKPGKYSLKFYRWFPDLNNTINSGSGNAAIGAAKIQLKIEGAGIDLVKNVSNSDVYIEFEVNLPTDILQIDAKFLDASNNPRVSAHFVNIEKIADPGNLPPIAVTNSYSTQKNVNLSVAAPGILLNDSDAEGSNLTSSLVTSTSNGTLALNNNGSFTYTPAGNFVGVDFFEYRVNDGSKNSNKVRVELNVIDSSNVSIPLSAHWKLDETNGSTAVASQGGVNGTYKNSPSLNQNGIDGTSVNFQHSANQNISLASAIPVHTYNSFSLSAWINPKSLGDGGANGGLRAIFGGETSLVLNGGGALQVTKPGFPGAWVKISPSSQSVALNTWSHVIVTYNGASGSFNYYINGEAAGSDDGWGGNSFDGGINLIGRERANYNNFDGLIDDARIYNGILSASDALALSAAGGGSGNVNDVPYAVGDRYKLTGNSLTVNAANGLLKNDVDSGALTAVIANGAVHGKVTLNANGSFTYTADANFNGIDTFEYRAFDAAEYSEVTVVWIEILGNGSAPGNTAPDAIINQPSKNSNFDEGANINFKGTGNDKEDGALNGSSLVWRSSIDGQIGTGVNFSNNGLSVGSHTITLTVTDSKGLTDSSSRQITVNTVDDDTDIAQLRQEFLDLERGMFIHFNMSTFEGSEWAHENHSVDDFNPKYLDCNQWAEAAVSAGMKYGILTAKHHDGFSIFKSDYTEYDTDGSEFDRDVVAEYADAFRSRGLKVGIYYSIWDKYHDIWHDEGKPLTTAKLNFMKNQLTELMSNYGTIDYLWFDGQAQVENFDLGVYPELSAHVKAINPNVLIINNNRRDYAQTDIYSYEAPEGNSNTMNALLNNTGIGEASTALNHGVWFWKSNFPELAPTTASDALEMINISIESNAACLINVGPNPLGLIDVNMIQRLKEVGGAPVKPAFTPEAGTNLALNKTATQSSTVYGAGAANDGVYDNASNMSHTNSESNPWWQVDLGAVKNIDKVEIWNRLSSNFGYRLADFYVFVSDNPFTSNDVDVTRNDSNVTSYYHKNCADEKTLVDVSEKGRYVRIQIADATHWASYPGETVVPLHLSEVRVLEGEDSGDTPINVAPGGTPSQSSTDYNSPAGNAINGNINDFTHTKNDSQGAWWQVDLGSDQNITAIEIFNRSSGQGSRLTNYHVFVSDSELPSENSAAQNKLVTGVWVSEQTTEARRPEEIAVNTSGRYVRIQLTNGSGDNYLHMAEVKVFAGEVNNPPVFNNKTFSQADANVGESYSKYINWRVSDADGDPMTISKVSGPAWLSISAGGRLTGKPSAGDIGENSFVVKVADDQGGESTANMTINVIGEDLPINTAPVASITKPNNNIVVDEGSNLTFLGSANDAQDGKLSGASLVWVSSVDGQIGTGEGFSTSELSVGLHTITLTVTDSGDLSDSSTLKIEVEEVLIPIPGVLKNVAISGTATQSSTIFGGVPERAIDGNTDGVWQNNSVTHTESGSGFGNWWQVDLGSSQPINKIVIHNRIDGGIDRLKNYHILVSNAPFTNDSLSSAKANATWDSGLQTEVAGNGDMGDVFSIGVSGRYVRVQLATIGVNLTIAELEVFAGTLGSVVNDLTGDGKSDLVWRNQVTGQTTLWEMDGGTRLSFSNIAYVSPDWDLSLADLTGDGKSDMIWRDSQSGRTTMWEMDGGSQVSFSDFGYINTDWQLLTGDLTGDGKSDLVWRNQVTGQTTLWEMDGGTRLSFSNIAYVSPDWDLSLADLTGDGKSDLIWRDSQSGRTTMWEMDGGSQVSFSDFGYINTDWQLLTGDLTGDGKSDLVWRNQVTGQTTLWEMDGGTRLSFSNIAYVSPDWDLSLADLTGDGKSDMIWRDSQSGRTTMWEMDGGSQESFVDFGYINTDWLKL